MFEERRVPATRPLAELWRDARTIQESLARSVTSCGDPRVDAKLSEITESELEEGWLRGPFTRGS